MRNIQKLNKLIEDDAFNKKDSLKELDNLQFEVIQHLLKILLFPQDNSIRKWTQEVEAWRLKLTRKNFEKSGKSNYTKSLLYKTFWEEPLSEPSDRDRRLKELRTEGCLVPNRIESKVEELKILVNKFINCILDDNQFI